MVVLVLLPLSSSMGDGEAVNNSSGGGIGGGIDAAAAAVVAAAAAAAARSMAVDDEDGIQWRQQHSTMTVMKAKERR
jgi:hypothetical protein